MRPMGINGHNISARFSARRAAARTAGVVAALTLAVSGAGVAAADEGSSDPAPLMSFKLDTLSSSNTVEVPTVPPIDVPKDLRVAAGRAGIEVPERIHLDPRTPASERAEIAPSERAKLDAQLVADSEAQLQREGHHKDARAQKIATEWAGQAADGKAAFNGDVGRGTTHTDEGTGQIYRLDDAAAKQRLQFLNRKNVPTTPHPDPDGFGVAIARSEDGTTAYLVEYFLK